MMKYVSVKILWLLCLLMVVLQQSRAQGYVELASVRYTLYNTAPVKDDPNASVTHSQWAGGFFLPLSLGKEHRMVVGAENTSWNIHFNGYDTSINTHLYSTVLQAGWLMPWANDKGNSLWLALPRLAADFTGIKNHDWQMGGAMIHTWNFRKNLKLKAGLYYNREFFGNYFMPLVGFDWKATEYTRIWGLLPGSMNVAYRPWKQAAVGIQYRSVTASFRSEDADDAMYVREGNTFWSDQHLSVKGDFYLTQNLVAYAGAGMTGFHFFQAYDKNHNTSLFNPAFQASRDRGFVYAGLCYRGPTEP